MIIAIDGPAASGKGTLAKQLARRLRLPHLDTGLLYRAVARALLDAGAPLDDAHSAARAAHDLNPARIDGADLRGAGLGEAASVVAALPQVRKALLEAQVRFAAQPQGAVLDGRDIGTVIAPQADVKIFVTASPEARARRRFTEAQARGEPVEFEAVLADILRRDARDANRANAPLKPARDAVVLDTTDMSIEEVFAAALAIIHDRQKSGDERP